MALFATGRADGQVRPLNQPQPVPPVAAMGVSKGQNGRPSGPSAVSPVSAPPPLAASPVATTTPAQTPPTNAAMVAQPHAVPTPATSIIPFKIPSPAYPEVLPGRPSYNPITDEWYDPRRSNGLQPV